MSNSTKEKAVLVYKRQYDKVAREILDQFLDGREFSLARFVLARMGKDIGLYSKYTYTKDIWFGFSGERGSNG